MLQEFVALSYHWLKNRKKNMASSVQQNGVVLPLIQSYIKKFGRHFMNSLRQDIKHLNFIYKLICLPQLKPIYVTRSPSFGAPFLKITIFSSVQNSNSGQSNVWNKKKVNTWCCVMHSKKMIMDCSYIKTSTILNSTQHSKQKQWHNKVFYILDNTSNGITSAWNLQENLPMWKFNSTAD
jgi:hypothetical protein